MVKKIIKRKKEDYTREEEFIKKGPKSHCGKFRRVYEDAVVNRAVLAIKGFRGI